MAISRDQAYSLLTEHTKNPNLVKHALGVEAAMRHYARLFDQDEELWGAAGLLHDLDYETHPSLEEHPFVGAEILRRANYPETLIHAVLAHAEHTGVGRQSLLDKSLYAVDELVGFIVAVALIRPSKSLLDLESRSVTKKFKDKAFCRAIERAQLYTGAEELGVPMREHVEHVLGALRSVASELGLDDS